MGVRPMRQTMVTLSDAETTETARRESIRDDRATMPAPPAAIGRFSIELNVPLAEVDFRGSFERGDYREALTAARERLSVSPADTSALRIAQRAEEALLATLTSALGGEEATIALARTASEDEANSRERHLLTRLETGPLSLTALRAGSELGRIETLDLLSDLRDRGHVRVNLSGQKKIAPDDD